MLEGTALMGSSSGEGSEEGEGEGEVFRGSFALIVFSDKLLEAALEAWWSLLAQGSCVGDG